MVKNIKEQTTFKTPNWKGIYSNIYISFNDVSARITQITCLAYTLEYCFNKPFVFTQNTTGDLYLYDILKH